MNLDELLAYNPQKRAGTKRTRGDQNREQPPAVKAPRQRLKDGAVGPSQQQQSAIPSPLQLTAEAPAPPPESTGGINGVSDEEKLRLLQEMDDEDDSDSRYHNL